MGKFKIVSRTITSTLPSVGKRIKKGEKFILMKRSPQVKGAQKTKKRFTPSYGNKQSVFGIGFGP